VWGVCIWNLDAASGATWKPTRSAELLGFSPGGRSFFCQGISSPGYEAFNFFRRPEGGRELFENLGFVQPDAKFSIRPPSGREEVKRMKRCFATPGVETG
jgi:hypothetical protein